MQSLSRPSEEHVINVWEEGESQFNLLDKQCFSHMHLLR